MDVNLAWNESEYGNVQDVRIPPSSLWKPDILMYNRLVSQSDTADIINTEKPGQPPPTARRPLIFNGISEIKLPGSQPGGIAVSLAWKL